MFSVFDILPVIGFVMDNQSATLIPGGFTLDQLQNAEEGTEAATIWNSVALEVGSTTLSYMTILPLALIALFGGLSIYMRKLQRKPVSLLLNLLVKSQ